METNKNILHLSGDPRSRGLTHGKILKKQIHKLLDDNCARINYFLNRKVSEVDIYSLSLLYADEIEKELPEIAEEIKGLAEGANITYAQATLLQVRREIIMNVSLSENYDCSLISLPINSRIIAQTIDLNSSFNEFGIVMHIAAWKDKPEILMYSFSGLLGYLGMNSKGLAIGINMVVSNDWQLGVPPYLLVRHLLEMSTIDECIERLSRIKRSSSRALTISDKHRSVTVEMTAKSFVILEEKELFHTNHFLASELQAKETINFLAKNSSQKRFVRLQNLVKELGKEPTIPQLFNLFTDHENYPVGICSHAEGDIRRTETVATIIMSPNSGSMYVKRGMPCMTQAYQKYTLHLST